jgi:hypothetical protein
LRAGKYGGGVVLTLLLGLLSAGCGGSSKNKNVVYGQVLYQGKPLPGGTVTFFTPDKGAFSNLITPEGTYAIHKVPVGQVKIAVQPPRPRQANPVMQAMMKDKEKQISPEEREKMLPAQKEKAKDESSTPAAAESAVTIPARYSDPEKSGLELMVTGGRQAHNIELK